MFEERQFSRKLIGGFLSIGMLFVSTAFCTEIDTLPSYERNERTIRNDWLITPVNVKAGVFRTDAQDEIVLCNGLIRRIFRLSPNGATVGFDNLVTGQAIIRGVKPEAIVELNSQRYEIGGLKGQPNYAYLRPEELEKLSADSKAFRFVGFEVSKIKECINWKRVRHHATDVKWPPEGVSLRMDYRLPESAAQKIASGGLMESEVGRDRLLHDKFTEFDPAWKIHTSSMHPRSSFVNEGKAGEIYTLAFTSVYAERQLPVGTRLVETKIHPGTDVASSWGPSIALVWKDHVIMLNYRIGKSADQSWGNFMVWDGLRQNLFNHPDGPIKPDKPISLRLRIEDRTVHCEASTNGKHWFTVRQLRSDQPLPAPDAVRIGKLDPSGGGKDNHAYPGDLVRLKVEQFNAYGEFNPESLRDLERRSRQLAEITVSVQYELYDGIPCMSKWITVHNPTDQKITLNRFTSEVLAAVEYSSPLDARPNVRFEEPNIHVETDYQFGGSSYLHARRFSVHWVPDPEYRSQVNWEKKTPCMLEVRPLVGPEQDIKPGKTFESFRAFILPYDSDERERKGLALRRMYRTIAPWVTENPLMMHVRYADWKTVKKAIDQCAEVGFEMVILTFGSGFNIENENPQYLAEMKKYADYAKSKGVEIGGYSLLASRKIGNGNDVVPPSGELPLYGAAPALTSPWGQNYMRILCKFFDKTGFSLLEHDGSYAGDRDITARPPLQKGAEDSRWVQWKIITDYYRHCRANGIYLNVPDTYFLNGSSKCMFDYYDQNWKLPRDQQALITRQNIYDGTWMKAPSMGWMAVSLTEWGGGGATATVEPLEKNLDHYERMLTSNLAFGVQACYRGTRLYDTEKTKELVIKWVDWFKKYRNILESDVIHGRRADGRDIDWMLHVNPNLKHKGMLVLFNPLKTPMEKTIRVNLYYTGLTDLAKIRREEGKSSNYKLDRACNVNIPVKVRARGMAWYVID